MKRRGRGAAGCAKVLREELERAEQRGEDRIRQRVLAIPDSKRYMHSVSHATFEVIDAAAVEEAIRVAEP
jgi:hypothetical protein